ncbi:hypothetical protein NQZ68_004717 [Dissostichus eleginoides]|nr:hypothetical protein NQZ68_004717 [Dissostichus eleginoides]
MTESEEFNAKTKQYCAWGFSRVPTLPPLLNHRRGLKECLVKDANALTQVAKFILSNYGLTEVQLSEAHLEKRRVGPGKKGKGTEVFCRVRSVRVKGEEEEEEGKYWVCRGGSAGGGVGGNGGASTSAASIHNSSH